MKNGHIGHIAFEKMSELYDGDITTIDEREQILEHLENCPMCAEHYAKLKRTMKYLTDLKCQDFECVDFVDKTIFEIKARKKKRLFLKFMPAVAASVLILIGASFIFSGDTALNNSSEYAVSEDLNDSEEVIEIVRKHKANILKVSDFYIEGEVKKSKFNQLRRDLGFRKVAFALSKKSTYASNNDANWRSGYEEVAVGDTENLEDELFPSDPQKDEYVRFKVFR